jgi:uroporphyrinogen-III synthase
MHLDAFSGLICTSQRAAVVVDIATRTAGVAIPDSYPCYIVGTKSAAALRAHPFSFNGIGTRNAEELLPVILAGKPFSRPLLFVRGDKTLDIIANALHTHEIPLDERIVYNTTTCTTEQLCGGVCSGIDSLGLTVADDVVPLLILCCSPSAVAVLAEALLEPMFTEIRWCSRHLIALGNSTAGKMKEVGLPVITCDSPTPEGFGLAMDKILHAMCGSALSVSDSGLVARSEA